MVSSRRLAINFAAGISNNFGRVGIQIVMLPLMARLLGPSEIGLAALALPILSFVLLLSDAGLGNSLALEKEKGTAVWSSAFWGLLGFSVVLAVFAYLAALFVAAATSQPRLPALMVPLCISIVLTGLCVIPGALMTREGKNWYGSTSDFVANLVSAIAAAFAALQGWGVWAMAVQSVVLCVIRFVLYNAAFPFVPKFELDTKGLLGHLGMGGALVSWRLLETIGRVAENAIVSRNLGLASLGAYNYANQVGRFFMEAIGSAVWANLYYLSLGLDQGKDADNYRNSQRILAVSLLPASALVAPLLPVIVPFLFGTEWSASVAPMSILLLTYPFLGLANQMTAIMLVRNRPGYIVWSAAILAIARIVVVCALFHLGLVAITLGLAVVSIVFYAGSIFAVARTIGTPALRLFKAIQGPFFAAAAAGVSLHLLLGPDPSLIWMISVTALSAAIYLVALLVFDGQRTRADVNLVFGILRGKTQ